MPSEIRTHHIFERLLVSFLSQPGSVRLLDALFDLFQSFNGDLLRWPLRFGDIASDLIHAIGDIQML